MSVLSLPAADQARSLAVTPENLGAAPAPRGRASWSGLMRLSLVAVPVKAYPATVSGKESHFNQLHAGCGQRIRYEKHCPVHGKVEAGAIVSGYPVAPDQYVVLDEADLDKLRPAKDKALVLERFLDPRQLDPALFSGRTLYLLPDGPAAHQPYLVLVQAMQERHKWALGRVVLSGHRVLALVRVSGRVLTVHVLHFPTQLRPSAAWEADLRPGAVPEAERQLAAMLIDASSQAISWSEYRDETAEQLAALVEATLQGRPIQIPPAEETPVLSLLDALKQSVAKITQDPQPTSTLPRARRQGKKAPRRSP